MPKIAKELKALTVQRLTEPGIHLVGGVPGLALQVLPSGGRSWVLRLPPIAGKRREMGLGPYPGVTLAMARQKAAEAREQVEDGIDPIDQRQEAKRALAAQQAKALTFAECSRRYIDAKRSEWKSQKHAQQWQRTLETHAFPILGNLLVQDIELSHLSRVLGPIWTTKTETASRLRGRIESVLDWATVSKLRTGENPARWRGNLEKLFGKPSKVRPPQHHPALHIDKAGPFMRSLREQEGQSARCLEFVILTACRSGEARGAQWGEIDMQGKVWTIPKERMKGGEEHRVPLSKAALALLDSLPKRADSPLLFPSTRGGPLSDMALTTLTRRMNVPAVPHGFRSTFRDWAGERSHHPREVIEHALAHKLKDKAEAAYARGSLFEKRRKLMQDWADFLSREHAATLIDLDAKRAQRTSEGQAHAQ